MSLVRSVRVGEWGGVGRWSKEAGIRAHSSGILICILLALGGVCRVAGAACPEFSDGVQVGTVAHSSLNEVSGISSSRHRPGILWAHNDSGGLARVWALDRQGKHLGTYNLTGVTARDWEDMGIGPGPVAGEDWLYVADTGDNDGLVDFTFTIYRVPEPVASMCQAPVDVDSGGVEALAVRYPDSVRHDCETLLVDPLSGDIFVCTRDRWGDDEGVMKVYAYPGPQDPCTVFTLEHVADVQLMDGEMAVGGDVSLDGSFVVIRTKGTSTRILLWERAAGSELWEAFGNPMCVLPQVDEPQGEAICFEADGCGYYTISEGVNQRVYYFARGGVCPEVGMAGDVNGNGNVDAADLALLASHWLMNCFSCQDFFSVDDFEGYGDSNELEAEWYDYSGTPGQSLETGEVYRGVQAMRVDYGGDNEVTIQKDLGGVEDWRDYGNLRAQFKGQVSNKAKDIMLVVRSAGGEMGAVATYVGGTKVKQWTALEATLDAGNSELEFVRYIEVSINAEGESGTVYFDEVEIIGGGPVYTCNTPVEEDLDENCEVNMLDLAILADNWMK